MCGVVIERRCGPVPTMSTAVRAMKSTFTETLSGAYVLRRSAVVQWETEENARWGRGQKLSAIKNKFVNSRGDVIEVAAQRSLRLDLTSAGIASALPAQSGASRTQAPSRPRRLLNIQADGFSRLPTSVRRKRKASENSAGVDGE
jgi:hypothetical protein